MVILDDRIDVGFAKELVSLRFKSNHFNSIHILQEKMEGVNGWLTCTGRTALNIFVMMAILFVYK